MEKWDIFVDGLVSKNDCGVGIILEGPDKTKVEHAINFHFKTSNNEAEYESLLAGIRIEKTLI